MLNNSLCFIFFFFLLWLSACVNEPKNLSQSATVRTSGNEIGNGGGVLVCYLSDGKISSIKTIDQVLNPLPNEAIPDDSSIDSILQQIESLDPLFFTQLKMTSLFFERRAKWLPSHEMPPFTHDFGFLPKLPTHCQWRQLVFRREFVIPNQSIYLIDEPLWQQADHKVINSTILHETLATESVRHGVSHSQRVQVATSILGSGLVKSLNQENYDRLRSFVFQEETPGVFLKTEPVIHITAERPTVISLKNYLRSPWDRSARFSPTFTLPAGFILTEDGSVMAHAGSILETKYETLQFDVALAEIGPCETLTLHFVIDPSSTETASFTQGSSQETQTIAPLAYAGNFLKSDQVFFNLSSQWHRSFHVRKISGPDWLSIDSKGLIAGTDSSFSGTFIAEIEVTVLHSPKQRVLLVGVVGPLMKIGT